MSSLLVITSYVQVVNINIVFGPIRPRQRPRVARPWSIRCRRSPSQTTTWVAMSAPERPRPSGCSLSTWVGAPTAWCCRVSPPTRRARR